jgi:HSP20 family protein
MRSLRLPGIDPAKDLEITVEDGTLHIRGERQETEEEKREGFIRRETSYGAFERVLPIPSGARTEDVKAAYSDGSSRWSCPVRRSGRRSASPSRSDRRRRSRPEDLGPK